MAFSENEKIRKLQENMYDKLEKFIDKLREEEKINLVEYMIARDVLFETTENHGQIDYDNNIAQDFIDDEDEFIRGLRVAYRAMKEDYPDVDSWEDYEVNEHSHEYEDIVYNC